MSSKLRNQRRRGKDPGLQGWGTLKLQVTDTSVLQAYAGGCVFNPHTRINSSTCTPSTGLSVLFPPLLSLC